MVAPHRLGSFLAVATLPRGLFGQIRYPLGVGHRWPCIVIQVYVGIWLLFWLLNFVLTRLIFHLLQVDTAATLLAFLYIAARLLAPAWFAGFGGGPLLMPAVATAGAAMWRLAEPDRYS